jgi:hypothetical protein
MPRRHSKVSTAPMAVASDGALIITVAASTGPRDPMKLVERAVAERGQVFVGIVLSRKEVAFAMKALDDSSAEISSWIFGGRHRRRREVARKIRKTPSRTSSGAPSKRRPAS